MIRKFNFFPWFRHTSFKNVQLIVVVAVALAKVFNNIFIIIWMLYNKMPSIYAPEIIIMKNNSVHCTVYTYTMCAYYKHAYDEINEISTKKELIITIIRRRRSKKHREREEETKIYNKYLYVSIVCMSDLSQVLYKNHKHTYTHAQMYIWTHERTCTHKHTLNALR